MSPFPIVLLRSLRRLLPFALAFTAGCASAPIEVADDAGACLPGVTTGTRCVDHGCVMANTGQCVAPVCYCQSGQLSCNFEHFCPDGGHDSGVVPDADASAQPDVLADVPMTDAAAE